MAFVRRTRATFRSAEFGFFGVCVNTRVQTPRRWGAPPSAGVFVLLFGATRPFLTSWFTVGMRLPLRVLSHENGRPAPGAPWPTATGHGTEGREASETARSGMRRAPAGTAETG